MRTDLNDQVALVTGSAHRVGRAIALALARAGVHVLVHYHRASTEDVRDTLHEIKSYGVDAFAVSADISQPEGVQQVMDALREQFGRVNILVNSASVFPQGPLLDVSLASWDLTMHVNLRAPFLFTQQAARLMQQNTPPGGVIVNIVDRGARQPWVKRPEHGISKAGLWMLTQVSALSLAPHIRVNAILPGPVLKTNDGMTDDEWARMATRLPLQITGDGDDIGRAVVYLAGESFITGALLDVDGGEHL
ncbi:MAG: SDR family oxidoreductase [Anaerolineae bacterium]|jgi:pteridine reductase|nr:SDR family oxidoreductase [Anaerolineae bacterium]